MEDTTTTERHHRVGQIWYDEAERTGYTVDSLNPLQLRPVGLPKDRMSKAELEAIPESELPTRFPIQNNEPPATPEEVRAGLVGRTITAVEVDVDTSSFPQGDGDLTVTLDNGNMVVIAGWGYDAWGTSVYFEHLSR